MKESLYKAQIIPVGLTIVVAAALTGVLWVEINLLNRFTPSNIVMHIRWYDVLIGLTIYLKTSIDFAIYIGHLMDKNSGWKNRVAIEIGTAVGNAAGTLAILVVWAFFKEVRLLLAIMILLAALVLFRLAQDSLEHARDEDARYPHWFQRLVEAFGRLLGRINMLVSPVLKYIVPNASMSGGAGLTFWGLFAFSFTIPFILGLDDFAGYVPLFNIVNVFGFAVGVFAGHMVLNMFLYISPTRTIKLVKNPSIALIGSAAFVGLGIWGLVEVVNLIGH